MYLGMGSILDTPDTGALKCGFWDFGVLKPECWCLQHPSLCSSDDYAAAKAIGFPEQISPILAPPTVKPPADIVTPPASSEAAQQTIDEIIAGQSAEWKAQNAETMRKTLANIDAAKAEHQELTSMFGVPWYVWLAGGLGVFALVAVSGGSPRRYGR